MILSIYDPRQLKVSLFHVVLNMQRVRVSVRKVIDTQLFKLLAKENVITATL